jgi:DNA replication protein DnaC
MPNLIDSQAIWSLRPEDIPGQIMRRSAGNDESIRIKPEVGLNGPDGNLLSEAEFIKIGSLPRVDVGQLVLFRIAKAGQQFYIDRLRVISSAEDRIRYNNVKQEFRSSYAARIETLVSDLGTKVEELATSRADAMMVSEREAIDKAWLEHNANVEVHNANVETHNRDRQSLELASSAFSTDRICLDTEKQEFQHAKQELEQGKLDFQQAGGEALLKLVRQSQVSNAENVETPDRLQDESDVAPKGLIKSLGGYFQSQNYSVDDPLLLQALLCLCVGAATGQFIVLTGPPGSGKTSLVGKIAQAIGAGSGVVPVRPAWIDATDLIGFYNPDINRYQPTPFLDNVLQAKRYDDLNRLYLLVLDEMNLGRVENYAADFLSLLEKAREGDRNAELQL